MTMSEGWAAIGKGLVAGFVATIVISILMVLKNAVGLIPQFDLVGVVAQISGMQGNRLGGWILHFLIGTVAWGILFVWLIPLLPGGSRWVKGISFGILAWVLMMISVAPAAGMGVFAASAGISVAIWTLILHLVFGAVLGATFGALMGSATVARASPADVSRFENR